MTRAPDDCFPFTGMAAGVGGRPMRLAFSVASDLAAPNGIRAGVNP